MLKQIAPQLERARGAEWMGMSIQDQMGPDLAEWFRRARRKGAVITDVGGRARGPRRLRPGDVVVVVEGDPVTESYRLRWLDRERRPRPDRDHGIWRERKLRAVAVALDESPVRGRAAAARVAAGAQGPGAVRFVGGRTAGSGRAAHLLGGFAQRRLRGGLREGDVVLDVDGRPRERPAPGSA